MKAAMKATRNSRDRGGYPVNGGTWRSLARSGGGITNAPAGRFGGGLYALPTLLVLTQ